MGVEGRWVVDEGVCCRARVGYKGRVDVIHAFSLECHTCIPS